MLTASGTLDDRVSGLSIGADDYLAKPFAMRELVARIHALGRRVPGFVRPRLSIGDLEIDVPGRSVTRAGRPITLTRKEFGVLETLAATAGQVVSAEHLLDQVWDENTDPFTNAVRITVMTLRRKLGEPAIIDTVIGSGYRLVAAEPALGRSTDHHEEAV
jgi:DNA-binding response OmpR family regulator